MRYETTTVAYVLDEQDGDRILTEDTAQFTNGETITGNTSGATATILIEDSRNKRLYISSQQKFITGETFTGQHLVLKVNSQTIVQTQYKIYNNF